MYIKKRLAPPPRRKKTLKSMMGLGDYSDSTQCSEIPLGDPYRKPGNYCATPDGGMTTFNSDGSTYRAPGAVDPDPAHPPGMTASSSGSGTSIWDSIAKALSPTPTPTVIVPASSGMSTTTMVALAGGAVLLALVLSRR